MNWPNRMASAPLMAATTSWRAPPLPCRSIANPRLVCAGVIALGLPSTSLKWRFMFGNFLTAATIANPIRWVKEILPPRVRLRWLLMTMRLSIISLAGMARTLVAVGTSSDADMFFTTAAAAPRSTWASSPSVACADFSAGFESASGLAEATSVLAAGGWMTAGGASFFAGAASAFAGAGSALAGSGSALAVGAPLSCAAGFGAGAGPGSRGAVGADEDAGPLPDPVEL